MNKMSNWINRQVY